MIEFFQITGSTSFAVRCALEEIGVEYDAVDIAPYDREQPPDFASVNPWRSVPALRDGEAEVYETGACLLFLAERFPEAGLAPPLGDPSRGSYLRWLAWLADTFRPLWERIMAPFFFTDRVAARRARQGLRGSRARRRVPGAGARGPGTGAWAIATASPTSTSTCSSAGSTASRACSSAATPCRRITRASGCAPRSPARRVGRPRRAAPRHHPERRGGRAG